jgi:hypothetical protein
MTQVTEKTVTVKVKNHPRDMFYSGKQTRDHLNGMMKYMASKKCFPDNDLVKAFLNTVNVGDIVGVEHNQYRVEQVSEYSFIGMNILSKERMTLSSEDLTMGLGSGFCEILYRDGKPYGIETEKQVKVKIVDHSKT